MSEQTDLYLGGGGGGGGGDCYKAEREKHLGMVYAGVWQIVPWNHGQTSQADMKVFQVWGVQGHCG